MGIWDSDLFGNDLACDVRDIYIDFLRAGLSNQDAYEKTLSEMYECIEDKDSAVLFWLALAETQWKLGRLIPEVRDKALGYIALNSSSSSQIRENSHKKAWAKTLMKLKEMLESPMPQEKTIQCNKYPVQNLWILYDLYAYQFPADITEFPHFADKYIVLQKIGEAEDYTPGVKMRIQVYDKLFDHLPSLNELKNIRLLSLDPRIPSMHASHCRSHPELVMSRLICLDKEYEYPKKRLIYIGNQLGPQNELPPGQSDWLLSWGRINLWLPTFYSNWHDINYNDSGHGSYLYCNQLNTLD